MFFIKRSNIATRQMLQRLLLALPGPPETTCTRAGTATQDDRRVFLTFPAVNAWKRSCVGPASSCPGHSARRERRRDWRSAGDPPVSIGTEARRGCVEEGLEVWDLPPSDRLKIHARTHASNRTINNVLQRSVDFCDRPALFRKLWCEQI